VRDQYNFISVLLAPPTAVSKLVPYEIDRPVPETFPFVNGYLPPLSVNFYERSSRNNVHHAAVLCSNARVAKSASNRGITVCVSPIKKLGFPGAGRIWPFERKVKLMLIVVRNTVFRRYWVDDPISKDGTNGIEINPIPIKNVILTETKTVRKTQDLVNTWE